MYAAMRTEGVLRHLGLEGVDRQRGLASQQFEIFRRDRQVKDALLGANRAVALRQQIQIDTRPKPHPAAMAAALALFQHHQYPVSDMAAVFCSVCSTIACS